MLRLIGPLSLTERHVQQIFAATSQELAIWRAAGHLHREQIRPGVYRYPTTEVEGFANTPGPGAERAREQMRRRRLPQRSCAS
ncbi:MAG: hypothetical protein JWR24_5654 [Actinoallomurus sp.]|nr:hypothetical protein [Actinoallomurus sp.]